MPGSLLAPPGLLPRVYRLTCAYGFGPMGDLLFIGDRRRCSSNWGAIRCQLLDRHDGEHEARVDTLLIGWANPAAGTNSEVIDTDWHSADYFDLS